jgi:hypothetical protein
MSNPESSPPKKPQPELKAISAAIIALVGAVPFGAVLVATPSFFSICVGAISLGLIVVGILTWIYQITQS